MPLCTPTAGRTRGRHAKLVSSAAVRSTTGRTTYGTRKATVYLPDDLKAAVTGEARRRGIAEAKVTRDAIAAAVDRPKPRGGLFASHTPLAEQVDKLLHGFGDR